MKQFTLSALALSFLTTTSLAQTLPTGSNIIAGSVSIMQATDFDMFIDQSSLGAIINWDSFDIGQLSSVTFVQPNSSSVILNRVTGGNPSQIMGQMSANGTVMLVNPDGILFGTGSIVDVGGLLATTNSITNEDFLSGAYSFTPSENPTASIVNKGTITINDGGFAALVAPSVRNSGVITATLGKVTLASGNQFTLDMYGDQLITLAIDDEIINQVVDIETGLPMTTSVDNQGSISADGGTVALSAVTARRVVDQVINNDGVIEARSVGQQNGMIILSAQAESTKTPHAPHQTVRVSGTLDASGLQSGQTGGEIQILGEELSLTGATIDVRGDAGGGVALIGGDYLGGNPNQSLVDLYGIPLEDQAIPTAQKLTVDADTLIDASAIIIGDGGKIVNWSDGKTDFAGTIFSRGGNQSGNGGFVEVSGLQTLLFADMNVDLVAPNGDNGTILFDPTNMVINEAIANFLETTLNAGNNAELRATSIVVAADIIKSQGTDTLFALRAEDGVTINNGVVIGSTSGKLHLIIETDTDSNATEFNGGTIFGGTSYDGTYYGGNPEASMPPGELLNAYWRYAIDLTKPFYSAENAAYTAYISAMGGASETVARVNLIAAVNATNTAVSSLQFNGSTNDFALFLRSKNILSSEELKEFQESVFINSGNLGLNGGELSVFDNKGTIIMDAIGVRGVTFNSNGAAISDYDMLWMSRYSLYDISLISSNAIDVVIIPNNPEAETEEITDTPSEFLPNDIRQLPDVGQFITLPQVTGFSEGGFAINPISFASLSMPPSIYAGETATPPQTPNSSPQASYQPSLSQGAFQLEGNWQASVSNSITSAQEIRSTRRRQQNKIMLWYQGSSFAASLARAVPFTISKLAKFVFGTGVESAVSGFNNGDFGLNGIAKRLNNKADESLNSSFSPEANVRTQEALNRLGWQ